MKHAPGSTSQDGAHGAVAQQRHPDAAATLRVLVADDEPDVRVLVRMMLSLDCDDLQLLPEAVDGEEAVAAWREHHPDVLVLDHRMPGLTGLDVASIVLAEEPDAAIVLFSASLDSTTTRWAHALGVTCVDKCDVDQLPDIVRQVAAARGRRLTP